VGFIWARQPQIRITKNWNKEFWMAVSVENPQTTFAGGAAAASGFSVYDQQAGSGQFNSAVNYSINHVPDVIGKIAWEPWIGDSQPLHMEVYGMYRDFYDRTYVATTNALNAAPGTFNKDVAGGSVGGTITWTAIPHLLDLQITGSSGTGIGRYGSGQLPDATLAPNGALDPVGETTWMGGGTWHVTPMFDLYAYGGQEAEHSKVFLTGTTLTGLGVPTSTSVSSCITPDTSTSTTCTAPLENENQITGGFWWRIYQGKFGNFRFGMQYSYTHLTAFGGAAGVKPTTDDSMVFTSIRYYPF
jgi:hypothetical protein